MKQLTISNCRVFELEDDGRIGDMLAYLKDVKKIKGCNKKLYTLDGKLIGELQERFSRNVTIGELTDTLSRIKENSMVDFYTYLKNKENGCLKVACKVCLGTTKLKDGQYIENVMSKVTHINGCWIPKIERLLDIAVIMNLQEKRD